jgi:hypothetical protein
MYRTDDALGLGLRTERGLLDIVAGPVGAVWPNELKRGVGPIVFWATAQYARFRFWHSFTERSEPGEGPLLR